MAAVGIICENQLLLHHLRHLRQKIQVKKQDFCLPSASLRSLRLCD
jgi:hypothetical protein